MIIDRDRHSPLASVSLVALTLFVFPSQIASAQSSALQPVKHHPGAGPTPVASAQIQIARLRQTADQLRLLAGQPLPTNVGSAARAEFTRHEQWLREAGQRVSILADNWEQRLRPLAGAAPRAEEVARALDLNAFFQAQTAGLQSKLRRESTASAFSSEPVRAAHDTAKVIIGHMN